MKNLTIRAKLLIAFGILLTVSLVQSFVMINKLSESNDRVNKMVDISARKVNLSNELMIDVLDAARNEKNIIIETDPKSQDSYIELLREAMNRADTKIMALGDLVDDDGTLLLNSFKLVWSDYKINIEEIIELCKSGKSEEAYLISIGNGKNVRDLSIEKLSQLSDKNVAAMKLDQQTNAASFDSAFSLLILLILCSLIGLVLSSIWIIRGIAGRIQTVTGEANKIASREHFGESVLNPVDDELTPVFAALSSIQESFREITLKANHVSEGDFSTDISPRSERDTLGNALNKMTRSLRETTEANQKFNWLSAGKNELNEILMGDLETDELARRAMEFICSYASCDIGGLYVLNERSRRYELSGTYSWPEPMKNSSSFQSGEGLIGQAVQTQNTILVSGIHQADLRLNSSLLSSLPDEVLISPFAFDGASLGAIELGKRGMFSETEKEFISNCMESIATTLNSAISRRKIQQLLEETQAQGEELQSQQEELRQMNEELEEQAQNLKQQQEELQMTNEELEEQTQALEFRNREIESARNEIEQKSKQLEISSKYKSEFLANMSHELRTPLNSLLILSKDLSENKKNNLTGEQVESAEIIYKSGHDLLTLINEVLDLSKIEAGKMHISIERIGIKTAVDAIIRDFKANAAQKGLELRSRIAENLPEFIKSDSQRLNQILKNLVSNAIKFTEKGFVEVSIVPATTPGRILISVADTGIGIPLDKQDAVFEAFQQADGGTSRKYGGTGLGLSISRELARILGGTISLRSEPGKGSAFSLEIPAEIHDTTGHEIPVEKEEKYSRKSTAKNLVIEETYLNYPTIPDDRDQLSADDKIVLIIEDDLKFASVLLKQAHQKGFKCLTASSGEDGLNLAFRYKPVAIILDIDLPGINGNEVLARLKASPQVRHIPVHIMSVNERNLNPIKSGAVEYLVKPVEKNDLDNAFNRIETFISRKMKNLLIVEDDPNSRKAIMTLIGNGDVRCFEAQSGNEALELFGKTHIDCIVLDLGLPDMNGFDFIQALEKLTAGSIPPIVVYTGRDLSREENNELQRYAESIIIKGVKSEERLLDETALFLHRTVSKLPQNKQKIIGDLYDPEAIFHGKKILLTDDDMRNVFALSKILKDKGMQVVRAENGKRALETLLSEPDFDMVLMDIMMPEMDGYEAMQKIRSELGMIKLPIIALTAKAMKDDKQKCIQAGANDYITKPVDIEKLLSLMRVWLTK